MLKGVDWVPRRYKRLFNLNRKNVLWLLSQLKFFGDARNFASAPQFILTPHGSFWKWCRFWWLGLIMFASTANLYTQIICTHMYIWLIFSLVVKLMWCSRISNDITYELYHSINFFIQIVAYNFINDVLQPKYFSDKSLSLTMFIYIIIKMKWHRYFKSKQV